MEWSDHSGATRRVREPLYEPAIAAVRALDRRITISVAVVAGPFEQSSFPAEFGWPVSGTFGES
jgi:hypothetical protein